MIRKLAPWGTDSYISDSNESKIAHAKVSKARSIAKALQSHTLVLVEYEGSEILTSYHSSWIRREMMYYLKCRPQHIYLYNKWLGKNCRNTWTRLAQSPSMSYTQSRAWHSSTSLLVILSRTTLKSIIMRAENSNTFPKLKGRDVKVNA